MPGGGYKMHRTMRFGRWASIHIEISKNLGKEPWMQINTCKDETIIDIPYAQVIFTPGKVLYRERKHRQSNQNHARHQKKSGDAA